VSDTFLVLALKHNDNNNNNTDQSSSSSVLSCFFVPYWLPHVECVSEYLSLIEYNIGDVLVVIRKRT
jgi:hypothetical protein